PRIRVSRAEDLSPRVIATGFPYETGGFTDVYLAILKSLTESSHGFRRLGSAALDLCYVACGRVEGYFQHNLKPYDVAGGFIIVQVAGGVVCEFQGGSNYIFAGEMVATNGKRLFEILTQTI